MEPLHVDLDLVRKYNQPGPRYTSYPPATRFASGFSQSELIDRIKSSNHTGAGDLSLYFHLPFCQTRCWYCGCTTIITTHQGHSAAYLDLLEQELALMARLINPERQVVQIHFGGGTPTFLLPEELQRLGGMIRKHFKIAEKAEFGVEIAL